jgi:hypothetical protein
MAHEALRIANAAARNSFYLAAHAGLLIVVVAGFAPTFYLRPAFQPAELPVSLVLHGVLLTIWFALAPLQAWLVRSTRMAWHRIVVVLSAAGAVALGSSQASFDLLQAFR